MADAFYVDDLGRRIDVRPDLAIDRVRHATGARHILRICGRYHGGPRSACPACMEERRLYFRERQAARKAAGR